jgi:hypothetical protein
MYKNDNHIKTSQLTYNNLSTLLHYYYYCSSFGVEEDHNSKIS